MSCHICTVYNIRTVLTVSRSLCMCLRRRRMTQQRSLPRGCPSSPGRCPSSSRPWCTRVLRRVSTLPTPRTALLDLNKPSVVHAAFTPPSGSLTPTSAWLCIAPMGRWTPSSRIPPYASPSCRLRCRRRPVCHPPNQQNTSSSPPRKDINTSFLELSARDAICMVAN